MEFGGLLFIYFTGHFSGSQRSSQQSIYLTVHIEYTDPVLESCVIETLLFGAGVDQNNTGGALITAGWIYL